MMASVILSLHAATGRDDSSGLVIGMLMRMNGAALECDREILDWQAGYGVGPWQFRLGAVLHGGRRVGGPVEAADRHGNPVPTGNEKCQRRSAFAAEPTLSNVGAGEGFWRPTRPDEIGLRHTRKRHERAAGRLLAHPAVANV